MASLSDRLPDNAPGKIYVDSSCIDCDQCRAQAPELFGRNNDSGLSFVIRQPQTSEEEALIQEIIAGCATSSIGDDGE